MRPAIHSNSQTSLLSEQVFYMASLPGFDLGSHGSRLATENGETAARKQSINPLGMVKFSRTEGFNSAGRGHNNVIDAEINVLNRFELFLLGDGEKKITETADTRMKSTCLIGILFLTVIYRNTKYIHFQSCQGGSYSGKSSPGPPFEGFSRHIRWLSWYLVLSPFRCFTTYDSQYLIHCSQTSNCAFKQTVRLHQKRPSWHVREALFPILVNSAASSQKSSSFVRWFKARGTLQWIVSDSVQRHAWRGYGNLRFCLIWLHSVWCNDTKHRFGLRCSEKWVYIGCIGLRSIDVI